MKIDILTLFPEMFRGPFDCSILKRAEEKKLIKIEIHNLRDWAEDKHKTVDDRPFGGGAGMVLKVGIIDKALQSLKKRGAKVLLLDAAGEKFTQKKALKLSKIKHLIIIAGHYEGIDHRVHEHLADEIISIGDYVLTGGEIPAMVIVDSVVRLIPGVVKEESIKNESHTKRGYLEHPQYTRPEDYKGWKVPKALLSGNPKEIERWKKDLK